MDLKSISGVTCYVKDLKATAAFYESLGFRPGNHQAEGMTFYVNWFWVKFKLQKDNVDQGVNGRNSFLNIKVENADEFYKEVIKLGMKPLGEPKDVSKEQREFSLTDPDGHKLTFFQKK